MIAQYIKLECSKQKCNDRITAENLSKHLSHLLIKLILKCSSKLKITNTENKS